jgi:AAA domain/AAA domain, putative AbiEii toxin, Type IV TA system
MGNTKTGAIWRRWDLHIHSPASIQQGYGGDQVEIWEKFIRDLEALPEGYVIGINDYIFLDGFKKVIEYKRSGRLKNIAAIFPVIELRIDKFGGTESKLSRVNLHVIFDPDLSVETIQGQFLNGLSAGYKLIDQADARIYWSGIPTRSSLAEFGRKIKESVPSDSPIKARPDIRVGFDNLNFSLDYVKALLNCSYFEGRTLTAVGKTEWFDIKWTDQSVAEKRHIIASADMVFTAAPTVESWRRSFEHLVASNVNHKLLDCSDAHNFSSSSIKDRIGNSLTWIKCDPCFMGLRHALREYEHRVYVGDAPDKIKAINTSEVKYIRSIKIEKSADSNLEEKWFDGQVIEFNPELVAIIGNKGGGKSALADLIAVCGNTQLDESELAFLNRDKFRHSRDNKAKAFVATIEWNNGLTRQVSLAEKANGAEIEFIKYLPQNFLEKLCNEVGPRDGQKFEAEIKKVIFSHLSAVDRGDFSSLDERIAAASRGITDELALIRNKIDSLNREICSTQALSSEENIALLKSQISGRLQDIAAAQAAKPLAVADPVASGETDPNVRQLFRRMDKCQKIIAHIDTSINEEQARLAFAKKKLDSIQFVNRKVDLIRTQVSESLEDIQFELAGIGLKPLTVTLSADLSDMNEAKKTAEAEYVASKKRLRPVGPSSLTSQKLRFSARHLRLKERLNGAAKDYQNYLAAKLAWEKALAGLEGPKENQGSLAYLQAMLLESEAAPAKVGELEKIRLGLVGDIYGKLSELLELYKRSYSPVQQFIQDQGVGVTKYKLTFEANVVVDGFKDTFLGYLNHGKVGSYHGAIEGDRRLTDLLEASDLQTEEGVKLFLTEIQRSLDVDLRTPEAKKMRLDDQLRKGRDKLSLLNFIYSLEFIKPFYSLKLGGRELSQLSPGEKGLVLLVFYLLVDKDSRPLVIDQPEENLDNQTVHELLVPCIKQARLRRQIFMVTHNPNLAVVCDAEQVVVAQINKEAGYSVMYNSGSIECPDTNKAIVDVLEGTMPAFRNRDGKYHGPTG